jgi:hypothetical protein
MKSMRMNIPDNALFRKLSEMAAEERKRKRRI